MGDSGLDGQRVFAQVEPVRAEFIIRACHLRSHRGGARRTAEELGWEAEALWDLVASVPFAFEQEVVFRHARRGRRAPLRFGWLELRLPRTAQRLRALVIHGPADEDDLVLLTNMPLASAQMVRRVYGGWRQRGRTGHGYRFNQEQGLDVESLRVTALERMRRVFVLALLAAQFVDYLDRTWPQAALSCLRLLGGKLDLAQTRDGLYLFLRGLLCRLANRCDPGVLEVPPVSWGIPTMGNHRVHSIDSDSPLCYNFTNTKRFHIYEIVVREA